MVDSALSDSGDSRLGRRVTGRRCPVVLVAVRPAELVWFGRLRGSLPPLGSDGRSSGLVDRRVETAFESVRRGQRRVRALLHAFVDRLDVADVPAQGLGRRFEFRRPLVDTGQASFQRGHAAFEFREVRGLGKLVVAVGDRSLDGLYAFRQRLNVGHRPACARLGT